MIEFEYPYYHLTMGNKSNLIGLTGSPVIIQKKYNDNNTFVITSNYGKIYIGTKKKFLDFKIPVRFDKNYFHERDNLLFYGSILNKTFVLWDVWDKYNMKFLDTDIYITKYKSYVNYRGKFHLSLIDKFNNHIYRFQRPLFTSIVCF